MNLVVVESPAKAKTIEKILGKGYKVVASYGHVRDLPKSRLGVDVENNFEPEYIIPKKSQKNVTALKKELEKTDLIYLATDLDREGEAIAWNITMLDPKVPENKYKRIQFHEITHQAIQDAVKNPRDINDNLVNAQKGRRVLDRLVGYNLSPLLWKKVRRGLSAGRVQSAALKLIVDREREIAAFNSEEYWSIEALLRSADTRRTDAEERGSHFAEASRDKKEFTAKLIKKDSEKIEIGSKNETDKIVSELEKADYSVEKIEKKEIKKNPAPPFITSTLQQEAARKLRFSAKKTMMIAQQLYEGIDLNAEGRVGLITYMRTDSVHLSNQALNDIKNIIEKNYGKNYNLEAPRFFKSKKGAQEAHEAIRPTYATKTPETLKNILEPDQLKLYSLIWKRAVACQMAQAVFDQTSVDIKAGKYTLGANGGVIKFDGFMKVYFEGGEQKQKEETEEKVLPELSEGEDLTLIKLIPEQHFTEPPARYTEASLVKTLEENGVGRPSTYAPTISTILNRGYVELEERKFVPKEIGFTVTDLLAENFPFIVNIDFTAKMEEELDNIAEGKRTWQSLMKEFYEPFSKDLAKKHDEIEKIEMPVITTDEICENCGKPMVIKQGRYGDFLACSGFPECKTTRAIVKKIGVKCPECKEGDIIVRKTKKKRTFWGCSRYPDCKFASWNEPQVEPCPKCQSMLVRKGKIIKCTECEYEKS